MSNIDADALIARFQERNKDTIAKSAPTREPVIFEASVKLKLLGKNFADAEEKLKFLCKNLEGFDDIVNASGELL